MEPAQRLLCYVFKPPILPTLAKSSETIPHGDFVYEPKWDGFRGVIFKNGDDVEIRSRNDKSLTRYFPEVVEAIARLDVASAVFDSELVIVGEKGLDFDLLTNRIHPAVSRIEKLSKQTPAIVAVFDLMGLNGSDLREVKFLERRHLLTVVMERSNPGTVLSPSTLDAAVALDWFSRFEGAGFDGVMAKPFEHLYESGKRILTKVKHHRSADCVVAGMRIHKSGVGVGSLLLGLFDDHGTLHQVGAASSFSVAAARELEQRFRPLTTTAEHPWARGDSDSFEQRRPGGQSRWNNKDADWIALRPEVVVEVAYDHMQGNRFRHTTRLLRERLDKSPEECTYAQLDTAPPSDLMEVFAG